MTAYTITTLCCDTKTCPDQVDIPGCASLADARLAAGREHGWTWEGPTDEHPDGVDYCRGCRQADPYQHRHTAGADCPIYGCTWPLPVGELALPVKRLSIVWQGGEYTAPLGAPIPPPGQAPGPAWLYRGQTK